MHGLGSILSPHLVRVAEFEASLGRAANNDTAEEELPVVLPVHAHPIMTGLLRAQDAEVLADAVLFKDGGHVGEADAGHQDLPAQPVGDQVLVFGAVTDVNGEQLRRGDTVVRATCKHQMHHFKGRDKVAASSHSTAVKQSLR